MRSLTQYIIPFLLTAVFLGCASEKAKEEAEIKAVIAGYNNAVILAYKNYLFPPLKEIAGKEEVRKVNMIVDFYLKRDIIMESELKGSVFKEIDANAEKAAVRTSEDWRYRWVNIKTGKEAVPVSDIHYEMLYRLTKKNRKWMIQESIDESDKDNPLSSGRRMML